MDSNAFSISMQKIYFREKMTIFIKKSFMKMEILLQKVFNGMMWSYAWENYMASVLLRDKEMSILNRWVLAILNES